MKPNSISITNLLIFLAILTTASSSLFLFSQSIRLDEAQSIWMYTKSVPFLLNITSQDVNLPLYGLILHFWIQVFGTNIATVRILSLIFFLLTLPAILKLAWESSNKNQAILTTALFAFSPFIGWYTGEARTYTLFALITVLNHLSFLRMVKSKGGRGKAGFFFSTLLGFYIHYFFIFLCLTQAIYILINWFVKRHGRRQEKRDYQFVVANYFLLSGSAFFLFLPWIVYMFKQGLAANSQPLIMPPTSFNVIQTLVNFIFGFQPESVQTVIVSLWPLSIVILFLMFTQRRQTKIRDLEYFFMASFLPILLVFAVSYYRPIFLTRYLILVTPTLFFILAWLLTNQRKKVSFFLSSGFLMLMFSLMMFQNVSADAPIKEDYADTSKYLESKAHPQDIIAISPPFTVYPIEYQYHGGSRLDTIPQWDRYKRGPIPAFTVGKLSSQIDNYKQVYQKLFVVLSYDQGYNKELKNYLDTHYQRLDLQRFSNNIEVDVYQLRY